VHTRIFLLLPPLTLAFTGRRFTFQRRLVTLWAWLTLFPNCGPLPQTSHTCAMTTSDSFQRDGAKHRFYRTGVALANGVDASNGAGYKMGARISHMATAPKRPPKLSREEAARELSDIILDHISHLPVEEQEAKLDGFSRDVDEIRARAKAAKPSRTAAKPR
jgi:hypothetical protein